MATIKKSKTVKGNGKLKSQRVNASQSMKGGTKVTYKHGTVKHYKIGEHVHAYKYREVWKQQAEVNAMIKESRQRLGGKHRANKKITQMKKQFYKARGLKASGQLSFKNLTVDDLDAYKNLLDAIAQEYESSTYLNPEKYEQFRNKMREQFEDTYGDINASADELVDIFESDIVEDLKRHGIVYTTAFDLFNQYPDVTSEDIVGILNQFYSTFKEGDTTSDEFLTYADDYITLKQSGFTPDKNTMALYQTIPADQRTTYLYDDMLTSYISDNPDMDWQEYVNYYMQKWG